MPPPPPTKTTSVESPQGGGGGGGEICETRSSTSSSENNTNQQTSVSQIPIVVGQTSDEKSKPVTVTLSVTNVVCSFSTKCLLNLRKIALHGLHVEYKKENNMLSMKLRKPATTASMWQSGKCTCTGAQSEADAYTAARRFCRILQKMNFRIKLTNYRVVNVLATCTLPFQLDVVRVAENYPNECSYEPELHPGATFKVNEYRATLKLFSTGNITLTAPSVDAAKRAVQSMYPILERYKFVDPSKVVSIISNPIEESYQQSSNTTNNSKTTITTLKLNNTNTMNPTSTTITSINSMRIENLETSGLTTAATSTMSTTTTTISGEHSSSSLDHFGNSSSSNNNGILSSGVAGHYHHPSMVHYDPWSSHGHLHHHHLHHHHHHHLGTDMNGGSLPPPPQPTQSTSSHHHWFGDNLLIDNVLDDFLQ